METLESNTNVLPSIVCELSDSCEDKNSQCAGENQEAQDGQNVKHEEANAKEIIPNTFSLSQQENENPCCSLKRGRKRSKKWMDNYPTPKSSHKGVTWNKKNRKWRADIRVHGMLIFLGLFDSEEEAAAAFNEAVLEHRGPDGESNLSNFLETKRAQKIARIKANTTKVTKTTKPTKPNSTTQVEATPQVEATNPSEILSEKQLLSLIEKLQEKKLYSTASDIQIALSMNNPPLSTQSLVNNIATVHNTKAQLFGQRSMYGLTQATNYFRQIESSQPALMPFQVNPFYTPVYFPSPHLIPAFNPNGSLNSVGKPLEQFHEPGYHRAKRRNLDYGLEEKIMIQQGSFTAPSDLPTFYRRERPQTNT